MKESDTAGNLIAVFNSDNMALHEMAKGILTANNIKYFSRGEQLRNVDYISDYLSISVSPEDESKARSLLKDVTSSGPDVKVSPVIRYGIVVVAILFVIIMAFIFINYNK